MSGVIDAGSRANYIAPDGTVWTYFQDAGNSSLFYVVPVPRIAFQSGVPLFHLTTFQSAEGAFVSGTLVITTELGPPPPPVQSAIADRLRQRVSEPTYQQMPFQDLEPGEDRNRVYLNFASADGIVSRTASTIPSLSGSERAVLSIPGLSAAEVAFLRSYFGGNDKAGSVDVVYDLTLIASLSGITARVQFNAQAAFAYQRTFKWVS